MLEHVLIKDHHKLCLENVTHLGSLFLKLYNSITYNSA
jgi:hypothetical protein